MFATEPIVLCLSLLSGFADALIFTFLESFGLIFRQWDFGTVALGLAFIPLLVGYCISYLSFIPFIRRDEKIQAEHPDKFRPEQKLYWVSRAVQPASLRGDLTKRVWHHSSCIRHLCLQLASLHLRGRHKVGHIGSSTSMAVLTPCPQVLLSILGSCRLSSVLSSA